MKGVQYFDHMKDPLQGKSQNGKINFHTCSLEFYLPSYNPNRPVVFQLILLRIDEGKN